MQSKTANSVLVFSIFFVAYWFFGNLYEEIVLAPNQLLNSYDALKCWANYFTITNPIYYYVPFTQIAVIALCVLYYKEKEGKSKMFLRKSSVFGILSILLTIIIVTQLNLKLFFGNLEENKEQLKTLALLWLLGNAIRLYLVGSTLYFSVKAYLVKQIEVHSSTSIDCKR